MLFHRLILVGSFCLLAMFGGVADADNNHDEVATVVNNVDRGLESIDAAGGIVERKLGYRRR